MSIMRIYISVISFAFACLALMLVSSCIKDDEEVHTPTCVITSMSVNDITSYMTTKASDGTDSIYSRTISGKFIKFNIDQVNGRIYSIDSLPSWTNLKRVVASFSYTGTLYAKWAGDGNYYPISNGKDSLDLSTPLDLLVVASDGVSSRHYTAVIYRYTANADSMLWADPVTLNIEPTSDPKLVAAGSALYIFAEQNGNPIVTQGTIGSPVSTVYTALQTTATHLDFEHLQYFGEKYNAMDWSYQLGPLPDRFYALDTDGTIYASADGTTWNVASAQKVQRLLAADRYYLYAFDGTQILATTDLNTWATNGMRYMNLLPDQYISSVAYNTRTNDKLQVDIMAGVSSQQADHAVVWYKVAAEEQASNQQWDCITYDAANPYTLPALTNLTIFHYNDVLYALGGDNQRFYKSEDNGITWKEVTEYQFPPSTLIANRPVSVAVCDGYVVMIQRNDEGSVTMWKGKINKLK